LLIIGSIGVVLYEAIYKFDPVSPNEIAVEKGDIITFLGEKKGWIYVLTETNMMGYIPSGFCKKIT